MTPPLWFAWVTATDTAFTLAMRRMDADILSFKMTHREGDCPTLTMEIKNPRKGLLNDTNYWAWLVYNNAGTDVPIFFGRLSGLPNAIDKETIELNFIARSLQFMTLKQYVAELLKSDEGYDPIFFDAAKRDDPDSVLEGYSVAWHYDRAPSGSPLNLQVSVSDLINPEDGWEVFEQGDAFYESVNFEIGQQPLVESKARLDVHWTQRASGTINIGSHSVSAWTGGALIDSWPKPGSQLSGGYTVGAAAAWGDGAQFGSSIPHQFKYENTAKTHHTGDVMSYDESWVTFPVGGDSYTYNYVATNGFVSEGGVLFPDLYIDDGSTIVPQNTTGDPDTVNVPKHISYSTTLVAKWQVQLSLSLDYEASRPRKERLEFVMQSDVQPVLTDPLAAEETEQVSLAGGDVGTPIPNTLTWYTLQQIGNVHRGQVVKSTPEFVGNALYAISVGTDNAAVGSSEPSWSDIIGDIIADGGVTWAMLGESIPDDYSDWQSIANSDVAAGTIIKAQYYQSAPIDIVGVPLPAPPAGYTSLQLCTTAGKTQQYSNSTFTGVADVNPSHPEPAFGANWGATTSDGTAVWTSLADGSPVMDLPLGLNPAARSFFTTERGQRAIKFGICVTRAKHRFRARIAKISWDCRFERALALSCRKGATLVDPRLPGGQVSGKITEYSLSLGGDSQEIKGSVTIDGAIGLGGSPTIASGAPTYGDLSYDGGTYQVVTNRMLPGTAAEDIGYSVPQDLPTDDGLNFPITDKSQIIVKEQFIEGRPPGSPEYNPNSNFVFTQNIFRQPYGGSAGTVSQYVRIPNGFTPAQIPVDVRSIYGSLLGTSSKIVFYPITQYYLELLPLSGVSFGQQYNIDLTKLSIEKQVDTQAASSP